MTEPAPRIDFANLPTPAEGILATRAAHSPTWGVVWP